MNMQKRTLYTMMISSFICILIYAICVFIWNPIETSGCFLIKTFISNIILGLLGSSIISGVVAFIAYLQNRKDALEKYIFKYHELTTHCSKYMDIVDYNKKVEWFDEFVCYVRDLETIWSDIGFIFYPKKNRQFLKNIVDYYNDFIWLTEDDFLALNESTNFSERQSISEKINKIVIEEKKNERCVTTGIVRNNRFTSDEAIVNKSINDIYNNRKIKPYIFDKSLVSSDVFVVLDENIEKYVKKMIELMNLSGETDIQLKIPIEVCKKLKDTNYIYSYYTIDKDMKRVNCQFILYHYFDLKKKCRDV